MMLNRDQQEALKKILSSNAQWIIGVDEVGLGAWAGPLVVSGIVFRKGWGHEEVTDSKNLSHKKRQRLLLTVIEKDAMFKATKKAGADEIDHRGVKYVLADLTGKAVRSCLSTYPNSIVVLDGNQSPVGLVAGDIELVCLPKADELVPAVGAASILAKESRDAMMVEFGRQFPGYDFASNKGYRSPKHLEGLKSLGICDIHRRSYKPIGEYVRRHPSPAATLVARK
jgi:ribonuclease HII